MIPMQTLKEKKIYPTPSAQIIGVLSLANLSSSLSSPNKYYLIPSIAPSKNMALAPKMNKRITANNNSISLTHAHMNAHVRSCTGSAGVKHN